MTKWIHGVSNGMRLIGPRGGEVVAEVLDKNNIQAANLIATAPQMLEALKLAVVESKHFDGSYCKLDYEILEIIKEAICLAESGKR